jgi:hypothetical protein
VNILGVQCLAVMVLEFEAIMDPKNLCVFFFGCQHNKFSKQNQTMRRASNKMYPIYKFASLYQNVFFRYEGVVNEPFELGI